MSKPTTKNNHKTSGRSQETTEQKEANKSLRHIYEMDADEKHPVDMSKLEAMKTPIVRRILISLLLILIAIAAGLAGTVILQNPLGESSKNSLTFDIKIQDEEITSGEQTKITIPYNNPGKVPLADVEITLHIPESFQLKDTNKETISNDPLTWKLGSLEPNEHGEITITGTFFEPPDSAITIQTITRYTPANFSSAFEDIESLSIIVTDSIYKVEIEGPEKIVSGEKIAYKITTSHNKTAPTTSKAELKLDLPQGFSLTDSSQESTNETELIFTIPELEENQTHEITIEGKFSSDTKGDQIAKATLGAKINNNFIEQTTAEQTCNVIASDFSLSLIANGQTGSSIILPGDEITINLALDNNGEETAEEITIELFIEQGLDRLNTDARSGIPLGDQYNNKINWDHTDMALLQTLRGAENAEIDLVIPTNPTGEKTITLKAVATINKIGELETIKTVESTTVQIKIASDIQASSQATYHNAQGEIIGQGPLPPIVGKETQYRVTWTVANALNDVEDMVMIAPIPTDSTWGGLVSTTQGTVHFDTVSNRIRWSIGDLKAGTPPPTAVFDIKTTPKESDIGKFQDLLGESVLTAYDTETQTQVSTTIQNITSEIPNDPLAANKGVVLDTPDKQE